MRNIRRILFALSVLTLSVSAALLSPSTLSLNQPRYKPDLIPWWPRSSCRTTSSQVSSR